MAIKLFMLFTLTFLASCNYSLSKNLDAASGNQAIEKLPIGVIANYQLIADGIMAPRCLECHANSTGNQGGINLESYSQISSGLVAIRNEISSDSMPKNRPLLTPKEKEVLLAWIDAGAPVGSITPVEPPPVEKLPDPDKIDYATVNARVIQSRCIGCHSEAAGNKGDVNLESYESVTSELVDIKTDILDGSMPKRKTGTQPLTDIQKQIVLIWIEKGAPRTIP